MKLLAALLVVAAAVQAAPIDETFKAGETLDYNLHWLKVAGGSARMTIAPNGETRYRMTFVGKSGGAFSRFFRVRDEMETIANRADFSTIQYRKQLDEKGKKKDELTIVDTERGIATRKGKEIAVPKPVFDPLSLIYYFRRLDLSPGASHEFTVIADGKVYVVKAAVVKRETLTTPAGTFKTVMVEPKMLSGGVFREDQHRLFLWYSDDERRLPVRIRSEVKVGTITATLRAVTAGVPSTEPTTLPGQ